MSEQIQVGRRLAIISVLGSGSLAILNITVGLIGRSTSVVAAGLEFAGDVLASAIVFLGMVIASRPPDENHPYGHGRFEILSGLMVGVILVGGGAGICFRSLGNITAVHPAPSTGGIWSLMAAIGVKSLLATSKFRTGSRIGSAALVADAWNDSVDIVSALVALGALALTISQPQNFAAADHYGGFAVGLIVIITGLRVVRDTSFELTDTMPAKAIVTDIRALALEVSGVEGVEKCYARKTGLQYHVDIHIEVNPSLTVARSHDIATDVRFHIRRRLPAVADVLVHVEPSPESNPI